MRSIKEHLQCRSIDVFGYLAGTGGDTKEEQTPASSKRSND